MFLWKLQQSGEQISVDLSEGIASGTKRKRKVHYINTNNYDKDNAELSAQL